MALNMDKIKARLASLEKKGKSQSKDIIWKPEQPQQVIRIVPLQKDTSDPFIHLKFYYDFGDRTYLSPASFNKPDPIVEFAEHLKKQGNAAKDKDMWKRGRDLEPKLRTYVPVIVRGEESKGVRFWGFGIKLYTQLMQIMNDVDYGPDVTSLTEGYDFTVYYKTAAEAKAEFPEITFQPKPKPRPAIDPNDPKAKELLELITTKQPDLFGVWEAPTYEFLDGLLADYLKKSKNGQQDTPDESNIVLPTEAQIAAASAPAKSVAPVASAMAELAGEAPTSVPVATVSPTAQKAAGAAALSPADAVKMFDNVFNT